MFIFNNSSMNNLVRIISIGSRINILREYFGITSKRKIITPLIVKNNNFDMLQRGTLGNRW